MRMLPPFPVSEVNLTSNVPISEQVWMEGTYPVGTRRRIGTDLYEVIHPDGTNDEPTDGAKKDVPTWFRVGKVNQLRMFDLLLTNRTEHSGSIEVEIQTTGRLNGVALFEVDAVSVQLEVTDAQEGVVYEASDTLLSYTGITNAYQYCFAPIQRKTSALFTNLPAYANTTIKLTLDGGGAGTSVGEVVLGRLHTLGVTQMDVEADADDFSGTRRRFDGSVEFIKRAFAREIRYPIFVHEHQKDATKEVLEEYRSTPCVFIGDEDRAETIMLGFYTEYRFSRTGPTSTNLNLDVEGLAQQ